MSASYVHVDPSFSRNAFQRLAVKSLRTTASLAIRLHPANGDTGLAATLTETTALRLLESDVNRFLML